MNKLRRLFTRARPESQELNILRGILASIEQKNKESSACFISSPRGRGRDEGIRPHPCMKAQKVKYLTKTVK
jgi:tRNA C32,U32 (ribose-2'-O)-methylase TrmJ